MQSELLENNIKNKDQIIGILMNENEIEKIEANSFKCMISVLQLNLSKNNKLNQLDLDFHNLRYLILINNHLTRIESNQFENDELLNLIELNLSNNKITTLEANSFQHLPSLKELNLSNIYNKSNNANQIVQLEANTFNGLENSLEKLNLSMNKLTRLDRVNSFNIELTK